MALAGRDLGQSLCESCACMREVHTPTGSRFLLCRLSQTDGRFPKYPAQPVTQCAGYLVKENSAGSADR
jgi:hypothetical protein